MASGLPQQPKDPYDVLQRARVAAVRRTQSPWTWLVLGAFMAVSAGFYWWDERWVEAPVESAVAIFWLGTGLLMLRARRRRCV